MPEEKPRLSFIVPVYKPKVLRKCLASLVTQSLKSFEVVVVLDGPDEAAEALAKEVLGKALIQHVVITQENAGACAARNRGAKEAKGDIWVFWDCDCVIEPHAAKAWVDIFDAKPGVGFIYSGYKFADEKGAINSQPFDPWALRIRNYISSCSPLRASVFPAGGWCESLKSLQDWDFWLSVVEGGAKGHFMAGYSFSTEYPDPESISGKGCTPNVWLERVDAVKLRHNLPDNKVCVTSLAHNLDSVQLAKLIGADFQPVPNDKPNRYETYVQVGFNLAGDGTETIASILGDPAVGRKVLFWTAEDIVTVYNGISYAAIKEYRARINAVCFKQFVEDKQAEELMRDAGFKVEILPLPLSHNEQTAPLPKKPRWIADVAAKYGPMMAAVELALPDMDIEVAGNGVRAEDITGVLHFHPDKSVTATMKRAVITGRHVVSNVESPFMGYVSDDRPADQLVPALVNKIRAVVKRTPPDGARLYWQKQLAPARLMEVLK